MAEKEDDHLSVVRHHNRVLRKVHKTLRRTIREQKEQADENFLNICETQTDAESALEKLWTFGGFRGPLDYEFLVEMCLRALEDSEALGHRTEAGMQLTRERQNKYAG